MARIRSIKPEIRRSLVVSGWPYPIRWTFVGLPGYCDDAGRGLDDTRLIKSELYPLDDDMTARKLDKHLAVISTAGPLCRYEIDGRRYLHLVSWDEHQRVNRPSPSRIPPCPLHEDSVNPHGAVSESSVTNHGAVSDGSLPRARPPAQARASAEQGAGKGAGSKEQGTSGGAALAPLGQPRAQQLIALWLQDCTRRPPETVIAQIGRHLAAMLAEGQDPDDLSRGLAAWSAKGLHPSALPSVVNEVMNARPDLKLARPSASEAAATAALEAGARVAARHAAQEGA